MGSAPLQMQKTLLPAKKAEENLARTKARYLSVLDANDVIYAFDASRNYNPEPEIEKIMAPVFAVNSADDEVNPPELNLMEPVIKRTRRAGIFLSLLLIKHQDMARIRTRQCGMGT